MYLTSYQARLSLEGPKIEGGRKSVCLTSPMLRDTASPPHRYYMTRPHLIDVA